MAGLKLVEELVELCPRRYDIAMIGAEPRPAYNRVLLSGVLAGDVGNEDIELRSPTWYAEKGIELLTGAACTTLCSAARDLPGVLAFRDLEDVAAMQRARPGTPVVVIGGGLLGIEAAHGLALRGCKVTLLHIMPQLMERQLDPRSAALLATAIGQKGI